jgi:hypothetical protein
MSLRSVIIIPFWCVFFLTGMYTLRVDCTPSLHTLVYDLTKQVNTHANAHIHTHIHIHYILRAHVHIAERRWYGGESTWVISGERKKHCTQVAFYDNILSALYDTTHLTRCGGHSNNKPLLHCLGNKAGPSSAKAGPLAPPMSMPGQKSWAGGELNVE